MVFWTGIAVGGLFVWLAVRMGFFEVWALLFNVVVSVYTALFLTPLIGQKISAAGDTSYGSALTLAGVAAGTFLILQGVSFTFLTGQFKVPFPKILDNVGAGVLGFLTGFLIWSFLALLVSATPIARSSLAKNIGFGRKIEQAEGAYLCWWCDLVNTVASPGDSRRPAQQMVASLLDAAERKAPHNAPEQPAANRPPVFTPPTLPRRTVPDDI